MQSVHVLRFPWTRAGFDRAFGDLQRSIDGRDLELSVRYKCERVFEEVVTNIIRHGYTDDREHRIDVFLHFPDDAIVIRFEDDGIPFDPRKGAQTPRSRPDPDTRIGGHGLTLVRAAALRLEYERTSQHRNRLTVTIGGIST